VDEVRRKRENIKFLPGFKIPANVSPVSDLNAICKESDWLVFAVPSQHARSVFRKMKAAKIGQRPLVSVTKGIEVQTLKTMSQVAKEELGKTSFCVVSGPTIAREVALKMPVAASAASTDHRLAAKTRELFETDYFRLFESDDVLGVEIGGSVKNVIAIASGIVQGLNLGSNMRAALFARGVAEMARLGEKMGARRARTGGGRSRFAARLHDPPTAAELLRQGRRSRPAWWLP
jgi:glycerol-3-phosphate dehydrogenase (NAD(P)+)